MVKRAASIVILIVMLFNGAGFYVFYFSELQKTKRAMRAALKALPDHQLEKITLSSEQFLNALVEDDEIKVDGRMYDVARVNQKGNFVEVLCLRDTKEENLISFISEIFKKPVDSSQIPKPVIQFITLTYLLPQNNFAVVLNETLLKHSADSVQNFLSAFREIVSPPPRS